MVVGKDGEAVKQFVYHSTGVVCAENKFTNRYTSATKIPTRVLDALQSRGRKAGLDWGQVSPQDELHWKANVILSVSVPLVR